MKTTERFKQFILLAPNAFRRCGHDEIYFDCIRIACEKIDLSFLGYYPKKSEIPSSPSLIRLFPKNKSVHFLYYLRLFRKSSKTRSIFFIEQFNIKDLFQLALSSFFAGNKNVHICLLFRKDYSSSKIKMFCTRNLLRLFLKRKLFLLTDSELVGDFLRSLGLIPTIVPIPHIPQGRTKEKKGPPIRAWWPGLPRISKGRDDIKRLSLELPDPRFELVVSKETQFSNAELLPGYLSRDEYDAVMASIDVVLLPYDPVTYKSGTSGILVEAICAGKMPFVKAGSWLEYELLKFDLSELVINWTDKNIHKTIIDIYDNDLVKNKLLRMKKAYQDFHTQEKFTSTLQRVLSFPSKTEDT